MPACQLSIAIKTSGAALPALSSVMGIHTHPSLSLPVALAWSARDFSKINDTDAGDVLAIFVVRVKQAVAGNAVDMK